MEGWKKAFYKGIVLSIVGIITVIILLFVFTPMDEFEVMMITILPIFFFIGLGLKKISYAWDHKNDKVFYLRGSLFLDDHSLKKLVEASVFGGSGTHEDPYRIINFTNLPSRISIFKLNSYILLEKLHLMVLSIKKCRDIIVNNNMIELMSVHSCSDLIITNNSINTLRIETCFGSVMHRNKVSKIGLKELESIQKGIRKWPNVMDLMMLIFFPVAAIYGGFVLILFSVFFILIVFMLLVVVLFFISRSLIQKHQYSRSLYERPNIITSNYSVSL